MCLLHAEELRSHIPHPMGFCARPTAEGLQALVPAACGTGGASIQLRQLSVSERGPDMNAMKAGVTMLYVACCKQGRHEP